MQGRRDQRGEELKHFRYFSPVIILVIATALWSLPATAEEEHTEYAEHHGEGGHRFKNGLALFLGVTNEPGHGNEGTWGLEYGYALSQRWGVGGLIDYAGGGQRNLVVAPLVYWKPFGGGLTLLAAPGVEHHNGRAEVEHHLFKAGTAGADKDETYFVFRLGAAYYFHLGSRYGIGPAVNLDFVNGHEVWVYGVNFEVMF
jgi:hypothetical protein